LAAVTLLSRALASRPWLRRVTGVALLALVAAFAADSLLRSRVWRSSRALFGAMVREAPQAPSAYAGLADALSSALPDSAVRLYNRALYFDQGYVPANINLGILYSRLGDHRRAVHQLRLADVLRPDSPAVQYNLGLAWLNAAEPDSALAAFNRAVGLDPTEARPYLGRGLALCFLGRTRDAEADLRLATARDPALAGDLRGFARGLLALDGQQLGSPLGVNRLGSLLAGTGDVALAETCYLRALELDSTWVPALFNQAVILAGRGDTAAALALASRARRLRPDLAPVREFCEALGLR
ncbi:tetratricopeptide repeat protein, partial [candidate division WOR-3 bacterium]|nr:tetratricopeptide repeat protein [candidate division WOR-3 bacterium]